MRGIDGSKLVGVLVILVAGLLCAGCGKRQPPASSSPAGLPEVGVIVLKPQRVALTPNCPAGPRLAWSLRCDHRWEASSRSGFLSKVVM